MNSLELCSVSTDHHCGSLTHVFFITYYEDGEVGGRTTVCSGFVERGGFVVRIH